MRKLVLVAALVAGGLGWGMQSSIAAPMHAQRAEQNARAECILPWYRFFGRCPEAIGDDHQDHSAEFRRWHNHHGRHR